MNCTDVDAIMTAYVDGEAAASEAEAVRAHLDGCPECRALAAAEQEMRARLQAAAPALGERAPAALWARCAAAANPPPVVAAPALWERSLRWMPVAVAATLLVAAGAAFLDSGDREVGALAAQLAIDHDRCVLVAPAAGPGFGHREARVQLAGIVGSDIPLPAESAAFDVVDVRECAHELGNMGHVLCNWRGHPVSLYIVPDRMHDEQLLEIINHDALIWSGDDHGYVLVAERGPIDFDQVGNYVRQAVN